MQHGAQMIAQERRCLSLLNNVVCTAVYNLLDSCLIASRQQFSLVYFVARAGRPRHRVMNDISLESSAYCAHMWKSRVSCSMMVTEM